MLWETWHSGQEHLYFQGIHVEFPAHMSGSSLQKQWLWPLWEPAFMSKDPHRDIDIHISKINLQYLFGEKLRKIPDVKHWLILVYAHMYTCMYTITLTHA